MYITNLPQLAARVFTSSLSTIEAYMHLARYMYSYPARHMYRAHSSATR